MSGTNRYREHVAFALTREMFGRLKLLADTTRIPMSGHLRMALEDYLLRMESVLKGPITDVIQSDKELQR